MKSSFSSSVYSNDNDKRAALKLTLVGVLVRLGLESLLLLNRGFLSIGEMNYKGILYFDSIVVVVFLSLVAL